MARPDADYLRHVPAKMRDKFVGAYKGEYGYWFEFDGTVTFEDGQGGHLPFAYGQTIAECREMMKLHYTVKRTGAARAPYGKRGQLLKKGGRR